MREGITNNRTARTLLRLPTDRVPIFEHAINRRFIRHAIGEDWDISLNMEPKAHARLANFMHMDLVTLGYYPRFKDCSTWDAWERRQKPSADRFLESVDRHIEGIAGTGLGLNVYVHGPLDSTYLSMGYEAFFLAVHDDLKFVETMMEEFTEDTVRVVNALLKRPLTTLMVADDVAYKNGLFIEPGLFRRLWFQRMQRIVAPIHAAGLPCFFHSDGDVRPFLPMIIELGIHGINPIEPQCNDIFALKREYGRHITFMGNLDIGGVLAFGTVENVQSEMRALLDAMTPGGGYIAMSSSSVADSVTPENYQAMIETVLKHGRY